jgi:hypothetical protein
VRQKRRNRRKHGNAPQKFPDGQGPSGMNDGSVQTLQSAAIRGRSL